MRCHENGPIRRALARVKAAPQPAVALKFKRAEIQVLVALCADLQRTAGHEPFFLTCRAAGELLKVSHVTAWRWLNLLCRRGILSVEETGTFTEHYASRYRYIATHNRRRRRVARS